MKFNLTKQQFHKDFPFRTITTEDSLHLGKLMYEGYKDTIDYENETEEEFLQEIHNTFNDEYGPCLFNCSFLIEQDTIPVAATIITVFKGLPLLAYTVTSKMNTNKGYSTFLIKKSINELIALGYKELYLVVTIENESALHIYKRLGFVEISGNWEDIINNKTGISN